MRKGNAIKKYLPILLIVLLLFACTDKTVKESVETDTVESPVQEPASPVIDLTLLPDESGEIMVLMYHAIGEEEEWVRSPENLRKDLTVLYEEGYRPISLRDFARGHITTKAGYTPVVLTFDDAYASQFCYLENGEIDPECAVGVLVSFHEEHPDFPLNATFFAHGNVPFRQEGLEEKKIRYLLNHGMDIGNHTRTHPDFTDLSPEDVQREIATQARYLQSISGAGYKVDLLALSFGSRPAKEYEPYLTQGEYEGFAYHNVAVLNVGWDPSVSPFHKEFSAAHIHRVRASEINVDEVGLYDWLKRFEQGERRRFISDGNPLTITVPKERADEVVAREGMTINIYDREDVNP